jgi:hypothetical protein
MLGEDVCENIVRHLVRKEFVTETNEGFVRLPPTLSKSQLRFFKMELALAVVQ